MHGGAIANGCLSPVPVPQIWGSDLWYVYKKDYKHELYTGVHRYTSPCGLHELILMAGMGSNHCLT